MVKRLLIGIFDLFIVCFSFYLVSLLKTANDTVLHPIHYESLKYLIFIWLAVAVLSRKYKILLNSNFSKILSAILKNSVVVSLIVFTYIFGLKIDEFSRIMVFGTLGLSLLLEIFMGFIFYYSVIFLKKNKVLPPNVIVTQYPVEYEGAESPCSMILNEEKYIPEFKNDNLFNEGETIYSKLAEQYLTDYPKLLEFITKNINLEYISSKKTEVLNTSNVFNIKNYKKHDLEFFINLHKINDYSNINHYFRTVNESVKPGGLFLCTGNTIRQRNDSLKAKYPQMIATVIHGLDFLVHRIFPKLGLTKGIYFKLTNGKNKVMSMTEMLGRLYYCGFSVIDMEEIHGLIHFLVKKEREPISFNDPIYGPLISMKRRGKGGKYIHVYKFRTMHPYSEYIHDFMINIYGFGEKGKVDKDFRVTRWGRFLRKTWLDELPQLINFFRGELAIVGVRPLSDRFLKEYPEELKIERFKHKCGCIPPYVALKMQAVDDYIESERIYFNDKKYHPFTTDIKYLFSAVYNILTKKIVSE